MARNGYLAEDGILLVTVEDNDQLIATAAASYLAWKAASIKAGRLIYIVEPAGAYRNAWVQNDMVDNPWRYNLNPNSTIPFSRYGQSHGWGNRVDIGGDLAWAIANAARFGWTREFGAKDPNHFVHDGRTAIAGAGAGGGGFTPIEEEEDMSQGAFYRIAAGGEGAGTIFWQEKPNTSLIPINIVTWTAYEKNGARYADIPAVDIQQMMRDFGVIPAPASAVVGDVTVQSDPAVLVELQKIAARLALIGTPQQNAEALIAEQKKPGN